MVCHERVRLMIELRDALRTYAEAADDLAKLVQSDGADTESMRRACRTAWENAERARVALALHEGHHSCDSHK